MNTNKIAYNKYVAEILGTLLLALVAALSGTGLTSIIFVGITLAFIVYLFGGVSGAHVNPAFTIAALTMKKIKWQDAVLYICAQLIGAGLALIILKNVQGFTFNEVSSIQGLTLLTLFKSEVVGTAIFSMAFSAVVNEKTEKGVNGFVIGLGLFLGLLFANIISGGMAVLNPAVVVGNNLINWATILGPIVGALIGAWLYRVVAFGSFCSGCGKNCDCSSCDKKDELSSEVAHSHAHTHAHTHEHNHGATEHSEDSQN